MTEQIRNDFEKWYSNQKLDQIATWHPTESLELDAHKYPNGRYTIFSTKQMCWEVWQAAHGLYTPKESNDVSEIMQRAQAEIVAAECEAVDTEFGKVVIHQATITPYNSTRNHTTSEVESVKDADEAGIKYLPETDNEFWTAEQILEYILKNLKDEDLLQILSISKEADMILFHSSVGRWIRNTFKLWHEGNPHLDGMHPDEMSFEILKGIWRTVQRREMIGM